MISQLSVAAEAAGNKFCFDCPPEGFPDAETIAVILGFSLLLAAPGLFMGMLVHRLLARWPLVVRLAIVGGSVVVFLFWLGGLPLLEETFGIAPLLAIFASFFDGKRVDAEQSVSRYSDD